MDSHGFTVAFKVAATWETAGSSGRRLPRIHGSCSDTSFPVAMFSIPGVAHGAAGPGVDGGWLINDKGCLTDSDWTVVASRRRYVFS